MKGPLSAQKRRSEAGVAYVAVPVGESEKECGQDGRTRRRREDNESRWRFEWTIVEVGIMLVRSSAVQTYGKGEESEGEKRG